MTQILSGRKTVEVRAAYRNIARLQPGDALLLNEQFPYPIRAVRRHATFETLVENEDPASIVPDLVGSATLLAACRALYPPEKEALGVVALQIVPASGDGLPARQGDGTRAVPVPRRYPPRKLGGNS